jgi:hypothetical protein
VKTDPAISGRQAVSGHGLANNSHDLNPIKNGWNYMKNKLNDEDISSVPKLEEAITAMWTWTSAWSTCTPCVTPCP